MSEPYTMWILEAPFSKHGVPLMGNSGASIAKVIVMRSETFKRLIANYPDLNSAQFRVGQYDEDSEHE